MDTTSFADAEAGYAHSAGLHAERIAAGWRPVGRKIGFTNRTIWARYGVYQPIFGMVYDRTLIEAREGRANIRLAGLLNPRMEPEICFGLKSAPPLTRDPAALLEAIDWIAHTVEIVQCAKPDWQVQVGECTAANGLHGVLVLGPKVPVRTIANLAGRLPALAVTLLHEGRMVDRGVGANVLDSPLLALAHLVELLAGRTDFPPLAGGELVSTGTITDAAPVKPGETWSTGLEGLPLPGLTVHYE